MTTFERTRPEKINPYWSKFDQLETAKTAYFKGFFRMN